MSDTTKVPVVWAHPKSIADLAAKPPRVSGVLIGLAGEQAHLLLPIEDGALRVGDTLFCERDGHLLRRRFDEPDHPWEGARPRELWRLLMDAVEGVEP